VADLRFVVFPRMGPATDPVSGPVLEPISEAVWEPELGKDRLIVRERDGAPEF
jgi:hypothetical protein